MKTILSGTNAQNSVTEIVIANNLRP